MITQEGIVRIEAEIRCLVGATWKSCEEHRERIGYVELLTVNKVENRKGSKLLGQRTQIKNGFQCYFCSGFQIGITVGVQVYDLVAIPDCYGQARDAIAVFTPGEVSSQLRHMLVHDLINPRIVRRCISIELKKLIELVVRFFSVNFSRSHLCRRDN